MDRDEDARYENTITKLKDRGMFPIGWYKDKDRMADLSTGFNKKIVNHMASLGQDTNQPFEEARPKTMVYKPANPNFPLQTYSHPSASIASHPETGTSQPAGDSDPVTSFAAGVRRTPTGNSHELSLEEGITGAHSRPFANKRNPPRIWDRGGSGCGCGCGRR